ncbi:MAG TPA: amidohydrolase family protein [Acidobacteriaceae bacterium]|jgi:L-fuconolactonase
MKPECIDAHHHLWRYLQEEYPWMAANMDALRRDYLLPELKAVTQAAGVTGTVAVQARQTVQETEWLAELAAKTELIRGVVGWAPLIDAGVEVHLEKFATLTKVKGVRHVLHDEMDPYYMEREDFQRGVGLLKRFGLRYDLLIFETHLPQTIRFVDRHPEQIFILDHLAKPRIREHALYPWRKRLKELAHRDNVYCKISGMVTEASWQSWTEEDLSGYFEIVFEAFGPQRTMFGSDWPVLTLASPYGHWLETVKRALLRFSLEEQRRVLAGTAVEAYGL